MVIRWTALADALFPFESLESMIGLALSSRPLRYLCKTPSFLRILAPFCGQSPRWKVCPCWRGLRFLDSVPIPALRRDRDFARNDRLRKVFQSLEAFGPSFSNRWKPQARTFPIVGNGELALLLLRALRDLCVKPLPFCGFLRLFAANPALTRGRGGVLWWRRRDLNPRHADYDSAALTN